MLLNTFPGSNPWPNIAVKDLPRDTVARMGCFIQTLVVVLIFFHSNGLLTLTSKVTER